MNPLNLLRTSLSTNSNRVLIYTDQAPFLLNNRAFRQQAHYAINRVLRVLDTTKLFQAALACLFVEGSRFKNCVGSALRALIPDSQRAFINNLYYSYLII